MKIIQLFLLTTLLLPLTIFTSCGNEVEEITDPKTGTVLKKYDYYTDDSGQKVKDGSYTEWNPDGSMKWSCNYSDGKRKGEEIVYLKSDSIVYNNYDNDLRSGRCRIEYKNVIIRDLNYANGMLNGKQHYFFANGKLNIVGFMKDNKTTNIWKHYDSKGNICASFSYNSNGAPNELIGKWIEENDNGTEVFYVFDEFGFGEFHAPLFKYDKKAMLQMEGFYQLGTSLVLQDAVNIISMKILSFKKDKMVVLHKVGGAKKYSKSM